MSAPEISICVPTYNGVQYLAECINSIVAQTYRDFEVLICDDQSSDGTLDLARELAKGDERFRFISNPRRFGLVGNWNNCIKQARGEWIKLVFQDDVIMPTCIETLLGACKRERKPFGFCERDFIFENGTSNSMREWFAEHKRKLQSNYRGGPVINAERATQIAANAPSHNLVGEPPVTLIKKRLFDELGGFDEALSQLCDAEFWCRVMINYGAVFVPANLAAFRIHGKAATAQNHAKRKFRMATLDPLILQYKFAFKRHFRPVRDPQVTRKSVLTLRLEVAQMAIDALSQAKISGDNSGDSLLKDWRQVTSFYPGLRAAACFGRGLHFCRRIKHQVRIRLPLSIQKLLGHESPR